MNEFNLIAFKIKMETGLREQLIESLKDAKDLPEMTHGIIVMGAAGDFCKSMKKKYSWFKKEFENLKKEFGLSEQEYNQIIDDVTTKVLDEIIKPPSNTPDDKY